MVHEHTLSGVVRYGWPIIAVGLTACADPQGRYDEFQERYTELHAGVPQDLPCPQRTPCTPPAAGELDGTYLWTVSAEVDPKKPVLFRTNLTTADNGGLTLSFDATALDSANRTDPVGDATSFGPFDVDASGCFYAVITISTLGPANPITGSDLTADLNLDGQLCAGATSICGIATGAVTSPANIPLEKSSFTFYPEESGAFPEPPVLNCAGDLANPL